jgi:RecA-family ATPase
MDSNGNSANRKARQADAPVPPTQRRLLMRSVGFSPIPVMGKAPKVTGWQTMTNVSPDVIRGWEESHPDHLNTGLLAGPTPGLDIDILNRAAAEAVEAMVREWFKDRGKILVRTGRAPKRLIPFRAVGRFRKKAITFVPTVTPAGEERREKIELLADGQQYVAFGRHPSTGKLYVWRGGEPGEVKPEDLPELSETEAEALVKAAADLLIAKHGYARHDDARVSGTSSKPGNADERLLNVDPSIRHELIMQLVSVIPNDTVDHGGDWIAVMHGIKGASGDPDWGRTIWLAFCADWTKGDADQDEDERVWDSAPLGDGFSGIHALLELAWRAGTPEAIAAVEAVKLAQAQWAFRNPPDDLPDDDPDPPLRIVCPTIFIGRVPPPRRWIVPQWIPYEVVTGFYGDGGVGKSLIAQQLQTSLALGATWLGLPVEQAVSLGVYCEDDENELWRRQCPINASYFADHDTLGLTHWMSRLGEDNLLMTFGRSGVGKLTKFHRQVLEAALDLKVKLVIIDTAADTFGGNENDRGQVRQFVQRALGGIALKINGSVVCCAHPSRAGLRSGEGDSGSTGWSNAFRSRLYISHIEDDPNGRILERKKANYASRNDELKLRWHHGVIIPDGIIAPDAPTMAKVAEIKATFLDLVREMNRQNRPVSANGRAGNYAPREFEKLPPEQRREFGQIDFEKAMNALFLSGRIENVGYGRKGDARTKIVVREVTEHAEMDEP